jgi:hypothetical protein
VREEDARGRDAPLDLKMPLENGRADERVSRGQASERAVCVCEAVSVEMGARRPPLPTAVVCPPGRCRRLRLAITAVTPGTLEEPGTLTQGAPVFPGLLAVRRSCPKRQVRSRKSRGNAGEIWWCAR